MLRPPLPPTACPSGHSGVRAAVRLQPADVRPKRGTTRCPVPIHQGVSGLIGRFGSRCTPNLSVVVVVVSRIPTASPPGAVLLFHVKHGLLDQLTHRSWRTAGRRRPENHVQRWGRGIQPLEPAEGRPRPPPSHLRQRDLPLRCEHRTQRIRTPGSQQHAEPSRTPSPPPPKATARTRMWSMFHVKRRVSHALQAQTHRALTSASLPADSGGRQRAISRHVATAGPRDTRPGPPSPSQGPIVARSEPTATLRLTRKHTALHTRPRPTTADRLTRQESRHDHSPSARRPSGTRMRHARLLPCRSGIRDYTPRSPTTREPGAQRRTRRQPPPHRGLSDVTTCVAAPTDPVW